MGSLRRRNFSLHAPDGFVLFDEILKSAGILADIDKRHSLAPRRAAPPEATNILPY